MRAVIWPVALLCGWSVSACGSSGSATTSASGIPPALLAQARPLGSGARFHPAAHGPALAPCTPHLGTRIGSHVELFAQNRVVLIAAAIGTRPPRRLSAGRIVAAGCYGGVVTLEPTGVVLVRPASRLTVADLFRSWGQPLSSTQLASFRAPPGTRVASFVNGRPRAGPPGRIPLTRHAEIVLEVGPHVPPHAAYTFPPGT